jgi:hypothetical protein
MNTLTRTHARTIVAETNAIGRESVEISHEDLVALSDALSPPGPYLDVDGVTRRGREYPALPHGYGAYGAQGRRIDDYPRSNVLGEGANTSLRRGVTEAMWSGAVYTLALEGILGLVALAAYWLWRVL